MKLLIFFAIIAIAHGLSDLKLSQIKEFEKYAKGSNVDMSKFLSSRPKYADESFDCQVRQLAYQYAQKIQPWRSDFSSVYDALELGTLCNTSSDITSKKQTFKFPLPKAAQTSTFYVDPVSGSDSNPGTKALPFLTIQRGIIATRGSSKPAAILLRQGTFYLSDTIVLGPEDSDLTISNYNGEDVYVSGGIPLGNLNWKPFNVSSKDKILMYEGANNVYGQAVLSGDTETVKYLGSFEDTLDCLTACLNFNTNGQTCYSFTHHTPEFNASYAKQCFGHVDLSWGPVPQANINSGTFLQMNVYVADVSALNIERMPGLQQVNGGKRAIRARYPNADTEVAQYPSGWMMMTESWLPPAQYPPALTVTVETPQRNDIVMFQQYTMGIGGPCSIFTPPESYWCSADNAGGGAGVFETPSGLVYLPNTFLGNEQRWTNVGKAEIHVWHPYHWAMWMYRVDSVDTASRTIQWTYGGFQGARGATAGNGIGGEWYIENILAELDAPNEYFYDEDTQLLYYFYNGTGSPPSSLQFEASHLKTLIKAVGTQSLPIENLSIQGINFVDAAHTFLEPHGVPSGGDWGMQRGGALFFEGTENLSIQGCLFQRLDGNGLVLSGYHRNASILKNEFAWIGDSPMVAWGYHQGIDGTGGDQPRFTLVSGNIAREFGHYEKQASPWFQAIACQTTLENNIFFNGPRALINFNDGFGGANEIKNNLLFNPNRETSDQGPFNSWDRLPFLTDVLYGPGSPSLTPAYNDIHHNFMICNYGSNMCIDNDDGSSYYLNHHNFEVYGGHKSDFGGHNKFTYNTIMAFDQDYETGLCGDFNTVVPNYVDGYYNNICIQGQVVPYISIDPCNWTSIDPTVLPVLGNNTVYNDQQTLSITCGQTNVPESAFQNLGFDKGTTVQPLPTNEQIIAWGKQLLDM